MAGFFNPQNIKSNIKFSNNKNGYKTIKISGDLSESVSLIKKAINPTNKMFISMEIDFTALFSSIFISSNLLSNLPQRQTIHRHHSYKEWPRIPRRHVP